MKNSWNIFSNDLKNVGTNWVALIIIGGLIFLPSLYAWLNITASWDPYGQTEQIPVGVVNEDIGETVRDMDIEVGDELIDTLKDSDAMDWKFLDRETAMDQLEKGDLFAVIMIPEDFSQKLGTVIKAKPEKANVEYYVNEKINAIAPKITEKGASVLVDDISSQFISTVNGTIFNLFNDIGLELEADLPDIKQFEDYVFEMEERLPEIHEQLEGSLSDATDAQGIVGDAQQELPNANSTVSSGLETVDDTTSFLKEAENRLNDISPKIKEDLANAQESVGKINSFMDDIESADIDFEAGETVKDDLKNQVNESIASMEQVESVLQGLLEQVKAQTPENNEESNESDEPNEQTPGPDQDQVEEQLTTTIEDLQKIKAVLNEGRENTNQIETFIDEKKSEVSEVFDHIREISLSAGNRLDEFVKEYNESIEPTVLAEIQSAKGTLSSAREMLVGVQDTIPEVENLLSRTSGSLDDGKNLLEDVLAEYPYVNDKINELANKIRDVQDEADINEIIDLLQNDPDAEESFFSEPVELSENKVFPIENYGSGMTPFYTVLSLWVGGLLLISLLATDVTQPERFTSREVYFGKLFFFLLIGILQTLIVTFGDIFIIQVDMSNPVWFVIFGLFCSFIFMTIIYSFVSIFGDVGKSMVIVMLVLQIAGSGGTYPVVLLPKFFQIISPFLPFTYAIDLMREAVGGIIWNNVWYDLMMLSIFGIIAMIFGTLLKEPINKQTQKTMNKSRESGVFH